ncbi:MAG: ribbon-helix-helix domain-containing protein [Propionibacteriaceae bacterium]|nr:ribbon-helix-helix domain-containing protein [Propionibacteriaceae bacterium]
MVKTTLYLPDDLKRAVEREADRRQTSEAEVMRAAIAASIVAIERPKPTGGFLDGDWTSVDWNTNDWLEGFGQA